MEYIKKYNQINEELKRKLSPTRLKQQQDDERREIEEKLPLDFFTPEEMKILKDEDFDMSQQKEAKNVEKYATFIIKKSLSLKDSEVIYSLTVIDNRDGKIIYERRIPVTKRIQHKDTLDFLIDRCSYILMNMKKEAMRSIDPYDEEDWDEDDKPKTPEQKIHDDAFGENEYEDDEDVDVYDEDDDLDECPKCGGNGKILIDIDTVNKSLKTSFITCDLCHGEGTIPFEESDIWRRSLTNKKSTKKKSRLEEDWGDW